MSFCYIFTSVLLCIQIMGSAAKGESTLQQVHALFRHGARTPSASTMYPSDPYINDTWYPYGPGALTNLGKKEEYDLGQTLRRKYGEFLGDIYTPDVIKARSTSVDRAKMSLQLVLAGLWPPNSFQTFVEDLPWQPIPYDYVPYPQDDLLGKPIFRKCSTYLEEYKDINSDRLMHFFEDNQETIEYINKHSGLNITETIQLFKLQFRLYTEDHTNRKLPEWTKKIYPEFLEEAVLFEYELQTATDNMLKYSSGALIKKILEDSQNKIDGSLETGGTKIYLYSGHEYNIAHMLKALKLFEPHIPNYASYIVFELHKFNDEYAIKVYYQDTKQENPLLLKIPGCEKICPIKEFAELTKDVIPDEFTIC